MRTIKTYSKGAPFYNAFTGTLDTSNAHSEMFIAFLSVSILRLKIFREISV
jgi:hypothetical protein